MVVGGAAVADAVGGVEVAVGDGGGGGRAEGGGCGGWHGAGGTEPADTGGGEGEADGAVGVDRAAAALGDVVHVALVADAAFVDGKTLFVGGVLTSAHSVGGPAECRVADAAGGRESLEREANGLVAVAGDGGVSEREQNQRPQKSHYKERNLKFDF